MNFNKGLRDQVKDAAFLLDVNDLEPMARHIITKLNDTETRWALQNRKSKRLCQITETETIKEDKHFR